MEKVIDEIISVLSIGVMVFVPMSIYGFIMIDKLIKQMYHDHNQVWADAGKPNGIFFYPEAKNIKSMLAMQINIFSWTFKTPAWIHSDDVAYGYLKRLRVSIVIGNLFLLGVFAYIAITFLALR